VCSPQLPTDARIDPLVRSFERSLRAERKSERTINTYFEALEQLTALLDERGRGLADATAADIQHYIIDIIERRWWGISTFTST
jgi:site-specific recombinase XerD